MRRKLHALISSGWYSACMVICIVVSIVPLAFRSEPAAAARLCAAPRSDRGSGIVRRCNHPLKMRFTAKKELI